MYNPSGDDNNKEFIEIFSYPQINFSDYIISDGNSNDTLILFYFNNNSNYSLIVEDNYTLETNNASVYKIGAAIGNGLSQDDIIYFYYPNTTLIDSIKINSSIANGNGYSMSYYNESWIESQQINGTPGTENIILNQTNQTNINITGKDLEITDNLEEILNLFVEYDSLFKITNLDHQSGITDHINVTIFYNISKNNELIKEDFFNLNDLNSYKTSQTGNIIFNESGNYTICGKIINSTVNDTNNNNDFACKNTIVIDTRTISCDISISISTEKLIYNNSESIKFYNIINNESFLYKIEYWIEDLFENEVKSKYNTSNTNQKSYTPNIDESDQVFLIKNRIAELYCNDTDLSDNFAEKLIIVKGERKKESTLNITTIYLGTDNKIKFGESLRVRVNIYKGDETKNQVRLWLEKNNEKISKITSANLYTNFIGYDLTLSVQIDTNCNEKYPDGDYILFLEAFDKNDSSTVPVSGITASNCKTTTKYVSGGSLEKLNTNELYEIINIPSIVNLNEEFISEIKLNNDDIQEHKYSVWSYIYRGSKSYSGEREQNLQVFDIPSASSALIELKNTMSEEGDFNLKIKIKKDEQKTTKDITRSIKVISSEISEESKTEAIKEKILSKTEPIKNIFLSEKEPSTVYLSSSFKARNLASYLILFLISFLLIAIVWKKTI